MRGTHQSLNNGNAELADATRAPIFAASLLPGITTILVPTFTRLYRSITSAFSIRIQPLDTRWPIVAGELVPWIR